MRHHETTARLRAARPGIESSSRPCAEAEPSKRALSRIDRWIQPRAAALVVALACACGDEPTENHDMVEWCLYDPLREWCPEGESSCPGPYQCLSYCIVHHPEGESVPDTGMGAWCDDPRIPAFGDFCRGYRDVVAGCTEWCAAHEDLCAVVSDGDSDIDADADADTETDADPDVDPDPEPECLIDDDCRDSTAAHCDPTTFTCTGCSSDDHCAHLLTTPACDGGDCYPCTSTNETACTAEGRHCLAAEHQCVDCTENDHCPTAAAARCDVTTHTCTECDISAQCTHLPEDTHVCSDGTCVQCTSNAHCFDSGRVCNYTTKLCVEACRTCETNADCESLGAGFVCLDEWPADGVEVEHCFQLAHVSHPACERPWILNRGACMPPETTTCLGIVEFGTAGCDPLAPGPCGEDGIGADGVCIEGPNYCSYGCREVATFHDEWCPAGSSCDVESGHCERP